MVGVVRPRATIPHTAAERIRNAAVLRKFRRNSGNCKAISKEIDVFSKILKRMCKIRGQVPILGQCCYMCSTFGNKMAIRGRFRRVERCIHLLFSKIHRTVREKHAFLQFFFFRISQFLTQFYMFSPGFQCPSNPVPIDSRAT